MPFLLRHRVIPSKGTQSKEKGRVLKRKKVPFVYNNFLWLILLGMVSRTTILVRQRATSQFSAVDTSAAMAILLIGLAFLAILVNPKTRVIFLKLRQTSTLLFILYCLLTIVSCLWSLRPSYTAFRAIEVTTLLALVFVAMSYCENFFSAEKVFLKFSVLTIVLSVLMNIKLAGVSLESLHTNMYSIIAGMGCVYCYAEGFYAAPLRKKMLRKYFFIFLFFLAIGTSAASNIATVIGMATAMILIGKRSGVILLFCFVLGLGLYITGAFEDFVRQVLLANKEMHHLKTMTGRSHLWDIYFMLFKEKPLLGYGFAVVSRIGSQFGTVSATNAHNGFLEVLLGTGICGSVIFSIWMSRLGMEVIVVQREKVVGGKGFAAALVVAIANNMSKSIVGGAFDPSLVVFLLLLAFFVCHIQPLVILKKNYLHRQKRQKGYNNTSNDPKLGPNH